MPMTRLAMVVKRIVTGAAFAFSTVCLPAHAVSISVDGSLTDIIGVVGTTNGVNFGYGDDPRGNTEVNASGLPIEDNNGFDIDKVYAYFDVPTDTLFLGLSVYGTVGNSSAVGASGTTEGIANMGAGSNSRTVFDANETYGIQLYNGTLISNPQLLLYNVTGTNANTLGDSIGAINNPYSLIIAHAVSESFNGVEFSITGLMASGMLLTPPNDSAYPSNLLVRFSAGSGDTTGTTTLAEDSHLLQMQVVPIPAAVWLFGSGLAGLFAVARKRRGNS